MATLKQLECELRQVRRTFATRKYVEELIETIDIQSNPNTMRRIAKAEANIAKGNVRVVRSVRDLFR